MRFAGSVPVLLGACSVLAPSDERFLGGDADAGGAPAAGAGSASAGNDAGALGVVPRGGGSGAAATAGAGSSAVPQAGEGGCIAAPPSDGLVLWLAADRGVLESDGQIASWIDGSPSEAHAFQNTPSERPALVNTEFGPALEFDGVDDQLLIPADPAFDHFDGVSFFGVVETDDDLGCGTLLTLSRFPITNETEPVPIEVGPFNDSFTYAVDTRSHIAWNSWPLARTVLLEIVHRETQNVSLLVDGEVVLSPVIPLPVDAVRDSNGIGTPPRYSDCRTFQGRIHEVLLYTRALASEERVALEGYLRKRWSCCTPPLP